MKTFDKSFEKKWLQYWEKENIYKTSKPGKAGNKKYTLVMFPYPSGAGLHVGHARIYTGTDVLARFYRMNGYSVLHPMGWDGFGLPAENAAIKEGKNPKDLTEKNIRNFKRQMKMLGLSYDWNREINTTDPDYYAITQWLFTIFFKYGLLYKKDTPVYYCPFCKTGLAQEEVTGEGTHERCGNAVEKRNLPQWIFKITKYADSLIDGLDDLKWPRGILEMQKNWIGKKEGIYIMYNVVEKKTEEVIDSITCFTTRPETNFGATFVVLAPEHELVKKIIDRKVYVKNEALLKSIEEYVLLSLRKTEKERISEAKKKTGVFTGLYAYNPLNNKKMPIWVSDFVLKDVGTGAVVGVPGHDFRDFEFAKEFNLPVLIVVKNEKKYARSHLIGAQNISENELENIGVKIKEQDKQRNSYKVEIPVSSLDKYKALVREKLEPGYWNECVGDDIWFFFKGKNEREKEYVLTEENRKEISEKCSEFSGDPIEKTSNIYLYLASKQWYEPYLIHEGEGTVVNSDFINGMNCKKAYKKISEYLSEKKWGEKAVTYHLRDWIFSRQRYWGEPIPMIFCQACADKKKSYWSQEEVMEDINTRLKNNPKKKLFLQIIEENKKTMCGWYPLEKEDLPLKLPYVKKYEPLENGESPLAGLNDWVETTCPVCGGKAKRESDTMPNWAGSCWYFLRFTEGKQTKIENIDSKEGMPWNNKDIKTWLPVDWYIGGAEQAVLHLLYARFWMHVLYDLKMVSIREPFKALIKIGMVLAEDGRKMSKSYGNVINPDEIVDKFGADALRLYEMFIAPFTQEVVWSTRTLQGMRRFIHRIWQLYNDTAKITNNKNKYSVELDTELQSTVKKVTSDITNVKFNTAIASLMEFLNMWVSSDKTLSKKGSEDYIKLLSPFIPFVSEEIWKEILMKRSSIHLERWPEIKKDLIITRKINIPVQIDGKIRDVLMFNNNEIDRNSVIDKAMKSNKVKKWINRKKYDIIYKEGKILSIITKA